MTFRLRHSFFALKVALASTFLPIPSAAEVTLTYQLKLDGQASTQALHVNDQRAWMKGLGGNDRWDLIFDAPTTTWALIDHQQQETLAFRQKDLRKIEGQIHALGPLLEGLKGSLKTPSGDQEGLLQNLLKKAHPEGKGISDPKAPTWTLKATGTREHVARLSCLPFEIRHGSKEGLSICPLSLSRLDIPPAERATLSRLLEEATGILMAAQGLIATKTLPRLTEKDLKQLTGLPLSVRSLTPSKPGSLRLESIDIQAHSDEEPRWPQNYRQRKIKLW